MERKAARTASRASPRRERRTVTSTVIVRVALLNFDLISCVFELLINGARYKTAASAPLDNNDINC